MDLQTTVAVVPPIKPVSHKEGMMLVGSCFTDHMASRLVDSGFSVMANPFGTLYNPLSIAECMNRIFEGRAIGEEDIVENNGLWHSWLHHGSFSDVDKWHCLERCNASLTEASTFIKEGCILMFTFGTAYAFCLHDGRVVGNCHKLPGSTFHRRRIGIEEMVSVWKPLLKRLSAIGCRVVFTVSPIRHLSDTAHGNQLSKATLLLAVEQLCEAEGDMRPCYFPAYEIVLDELRDYRFYDRDMVHPSPLAVDIVWQRFQETYMSAETRKICEKFQQLHKLKAHRPLFPESDAARQHQQRVDAMEMECQRLLHR